MAADAASQQRVRLLSAAFNNVLGVVFLIFFFAIVQMLTLWRVCSAGMTTAASLEHQGLPTLNELASLQEHLAIYRLDSYECLFAREDEKLAKAQAADAIAAQTHAEFDTLRKLFPEGEARRLASNLGDAFGDLDAEFRKVRSLVDTDFAAAMRAMDRDIPPRIERMTAAADALKAYGYRISGGQANATFGSFRWIQTNAIMFGAGNILVAFGAVLFVLLAARRSRAQLSDTLARLDERTQELAGSLSLVNATLESTIDGILVVDKKGRITTFNRRFAEMWRIPAEAFAARELNPIIASVSGQLKDADGFERNVRQLYADPDAETFDVLEFNDGRTFERYSKPQRVQGLTVGRVSCFRDVTERKLAETKLTETHKQLVRSSRQAGMAEVATGVLHNVGNVLNSVNVSASLVVKNVRNTKAAGIAKLAALLDEHKADLAGFLTNDSRGQMIPGYLGALADSLEGEHRALIEEVEQLRKNVEHIKEIVAMQQSYARISGFIETISVADLIEDALRINAESLARHDIGAFRDYQAQPVVTTDRHKVTQILTNLVSNAMHACDESGRADKQITVRTTSDDRGVKIVVIDNGIGIPPENLTKIFSHGFTTRKNGHGFGLHSSALAAKELGGSLAVESGGTGQGATFVLELPFKPEAPVEEFSAA